MEPIDFYREIRAVPKGELLHLRTAYSLSNPSYRSNPLGRAEDYILIFGELRVERQNGDEVITAVEALDGRIVTIQFEPELQMHTCEHRGTKGNIPRHNVETKLRPKGYTDILDMNRGEAAIQEFLRRQEMQHLNYVVRSVVNSPGYPRT